jgi:hypothetical protein
MIGRVLVVLANPMHHRDRRVAMLPGRGNAFLAHENGNVCIMALPAAHETIATTY